MRFHQDERRTAYCDLFGQPGGETNLFIVNPGQRTCWHRHQNQSDTFRVVRGVVRFGIFDAVPPPPRYTTLDSPDQSFYVAPGFWHGYENIGTEPAYLLMYLDRKYSPDDEERMSEDVVPWKSGLVPGYQPGWSDGQGLDGWGVNG